MKSTAGADNAQKEEWAEAAERSWRELIDLNPDNLDYYKAFLANAGIDLGNARNADLVSMQSYAMKDSLTDESRTKALAILEEFSSKHPKANTHQRLALTIAQGKRG